MEGGRADAEIGGSEYNEKRPRAQRGRRGRAAGERKRREEET